jgi:hypothetical protein
MNLDRGQADAVSDVDNYLPEPIPGPTPKDELHMHGDMIQHDARQVQQCLDSASEVIDATSMREGRL